MPSLFNRPTWAKPHNTNKDEDEDVNIFSHSNSFQDIVADQQRRKKEKSERKKVKAERRSSGKHKREKDEEDDGLLKKRRITFEDGEALLKRVGLSASLAIEVDVDDESKSEVARPVRQSPRLIRHQRNEQLEPPFRSSHSRAEVVEIQDGSDDNDEPVIQHVRTVEPAEEPESDEEFAELKRKARLQREQKEHNNQSSGKADAAAHTSNTNGGAQDHRNYKPPISEDEPVVQLFIQSCIPNTKELLVYRKLSQRLEEVRKGWCKRQNFPPEFSANVFFIHRMRRCYDVTTCKSLGLEVDAFGNLTMKGAEGKEGAEKVHLQAVTSEIFEALLAERDLEVNQRNRNLAAEDHADAGANDENVSNEDPLFRVTLVAKNSEDLKLRIRPTTLLSKVAAAYCKQLLGDGASVRLEFDGDELDPEAMVQDTEVSDMDIIHVYPT